MLQAKNEYGEWVTPALLNRMDLAVLRRHKHVCPFCKQPVVLRAGPRVIAHFAHHSAEDCPNLDKGEGADHEQGKLLLFHWLRQQFSSAVSLETWLPDIQQRPDLYLTLGHRKIAIEYQCARISASDIEKRNHGYAQLRITPIWILGPNHFKRLHGHCFRLTLFIKQFIHTFSPGYPHTLFFYHPETSEIAIVKDIYEIDQKRAMGRMTICKITDLKFNELFRPEQFDLVSLLKHWQKEKTRFRLAPLKRQYGANLAWQQWLYGQGMHRERLPAIVYLPVPSQHLMKTPLWNWQSRLCIERLIPLATGELVSLESCIAHIKGHCSRSLYNATTDHPVYGYLSWLVLLGILTEVAPHIFEKQQPIPVPDHIETAMALDQTMLEELCKKLSTIEA